MVEDDIEAEDDIGTVDDIRAVDDVGDTKAWVVYRSVVEVVDSKFGVLDSMTGADKMVLAGQYTLWAGWCPVNHKAKMQK